MSGPFENKVVVRSAGQKIFVDSAGHVTVAHAGPPGPPGAPGTGGGDSLWTDDDDHITGPDDVGVVSQWGLAVSGNGPVELKGFRNPNSVLQSELYSLDGPTLQGKSAVGIAVGDATSGISQDRLVARFTSSGLEIDPDGSGFKVVPLDSPSSLLFTDIAVYDDNDLIVFVDPGPVNTTNVLVTGRSIGSENGLYDVSTVDGWTLVEPQPMYVLTKDLVGWPSFTPVFPDDNLAWVMFQKDGSNWAQRGLIPELSSGPSDPTHVPTPVGQPDGKMLYVQTDTLVYGDAPESGGAGLNVVRAATTENITLSGTQTIDGVTLIADDPVLVKNQSTPAENGTYYVKAGAWLLTEWDGPDVTMVVREGTVNGARIFTNASNISPVPQAFPASSVTSGVFDSARIPSLDASKLTTGTFDIGRVEWNGGLTGFASPPPSTLYPAGGGTQPLAETIPGWLNPGASATIASGRLVLIGITLPKGQPITSITFAGAAALGSPTNQWFSLLNAAMQIVAVTINDTTTAWGTNAYKTLALTAGYTPPSTGVYHLGFMATCASGSIRAQSLGTAIRARSWLADTGLTTPLGIGFTATVASLNTSIYWGWVN